MANDQGLFSSARHNPVGDIIAQLADEGFQNRSLAICFGCVAKSADLYHMKPDTRPLGRARRVPNFARRRKAGYQDEVIDITLRRPLDLDAEMAPVIG